MLRHPRGGESRHPRRGSPGGELALARPAAGVASRSLRHASSGAPSRAAGRSSSSAGPGVCGSPQTGRQGLHRSTAPWRCAASAPRCSPDPCGSKRRCCWRRCGRALLAPRLPATAGAISSAGGPSVARGGGCSQTPVPSGWSTRAPCPAVPIRPAAFASASMPRPTGRSISNCPLSSPPISSSRPKPQAAPKNATTETLTNLGRDDPPRPGQLRRRHRRSPAEPTRASGTSRVEADPTACLCVGQPLLNASSSPQAITDHCRSAADPVAGGAASDCCSCGTTRLSSMSRAVHVRCRQWPAEEFRNHETPVMGFRGQS